MMSRHALKNEFRRTAAAAYAIYPEELEKLVIVMAPSSRKPVYVSPAIADQLTNDISVIRAAIKNRTELLEEKGWAALASRNFKVGDIYVNMLTLSEDIVSDFSPRCPKDMKIIFNLDHEIGHYILKNGFNGGSSQPTESACDAFAMLRHIQRFGKDTDHAGNEAERMAFTMVVDGGHHYTTAAILRAIKISEERDISKLTLQETVALAEEIAEQCGLDDEAIKKLHDTFAPVADSYKKVGSNSVGTVKKCIAITRKHKNDQLIFDAGKHYLLHPAVKAFIEKEAQTVPYWKNALSFVQNHKPKAPVHN